MIENGDPVAMVAASSTAAPSCYRVSLLLGSLEVSARLKSADDLELLVRVLEANKALFTKADKLEPQILADADRPATKLSTTQSEKAGEKLHHLAASQPDVAFQVSIFQSANDGESGLYDVAVAE